MTKKETKNRTFTIYSIGISYCSDFPLWDISRVIFPGDLKCWFVSICFLRIEFKFSVYQSEEVMVLK